MEEGYVYCMTNEHMPLFIKVGYTDRTPEDRLAEANHDTWSIPVWKCEFSCKVKDPRVVEKLLHQILGKYRITDRREFFRCPAEEVRPLFDLLRTQQEEEKEEVPVKSPAPREIKKCFRDGQMLKHMYMENEWRVIYKAEKGVFHCLTNAIEYDSLLKINAAHKFAVNPSLKKIVNKWDDWTCMSEEGDFISIKDLPEAKDSKSTTTSSTLTYSTVHSDQPQENTYD